MDRHVVDALPRLLFHHIEEVLRPHVHDVVELLGHLVNSARCRRARWPRLDDPTANRIDLLAGGEIHDGVGAAANCQDEFLQFALGPARDGPTCQCWR